MCLILGIRRKSLIFKFKGFFKTCLRFRVVSESEATMNKFYTLQETEIEENSDTFSGFKVNELSSGSRVVL